MTKKGLTLSILAAVLAVIYITFFTDLFGERNIQIMTSVRPNRPSAVPRWDSGNVNPVAFKLDRKYELTSLKVVVAEEYTGNKFAVPLWHLVADDGSLPLDTVVYGEKIKGMHPKMADIEPQPLEAEIVYLLLLEAGSSKGQTNFITKGL